MRGGVDLVTCPPFVHLHHPHIFTREGLTWGVSNSAFCGGQSRISENPVIRLLSNINNLQGASLREYYRPIISNYLNNKDIMYYAHYACTPHMRAPTQGGTIWRGLCFWPSHIRIMP